MNNQKVKIVCIAGLPGSGKTIYIGNHLENFKRFDDIGVDCLKNGRIQDVVKEIESGNSVVISDIQFCTPEFRQDFNLFFEKRGEQIDWVCFKNEPWKCSVNSLARMLERRKTPEKYPNHLQDFFNEIIDYIPNLYKVYVPFGQIEDVTQTDGAKTYTQ